MNEKKLTDEEIVKAYIHCVLKRGDCDNCLYDEVGCGVDGNDLIKIINRQKAEIERLKDENIEERDIHFKNLCGYKDEIARLQKQVDELTRKIESYQHSFEYSQYSLPVKKRNGD